MIDPQLVVPFLFLMLLYFVWSTYSHIKLLQGLEVKLVVTKSDFIETQNLFNKLVNQVNIELIEIANLENTLINKELTSLKYQKEKHDLEKAFGNISRPTNRELEKMVPETTFFPVIDKYRLPELPKLPNNDPYKI